MSEYRTDEKSFRSGVGTVGICGLLLAGLATSYAYSHRNRFFPPQSERDIVLALPDLLIFALGIFLIGYWAYAVIYRVHISGTGITIFTGPFRKVIRWDKVVAVYGAVPMRERGVPINLGICRLQLDNGRRVRVPGTFKNFAILADVIHSTVLNRLWPEAVRTLRGGGELAFGPITLRAGGICGGGRFVPWRSFGGFWFPAGNFNAVEIRFYAAGEAKQWFSVPYSQLPNAHMMLTLARSFARAAGADACCMQTSRRRLSFPPVSVTTAVPAPSPKLPNGAPKSGSGPSRPAGTRSVAAARIPEPLLNLPKSRHAITWRSQLTKSYNTTWILTLFAGLCFAVFALLAFILLCKSRPIQTEIYCILIPAGGFALLAYLIGRGSIMEINLSNDGMMLARRSITTRRAWSEIDKIYISEILIRGERRAECQLIFTDSRKMRLDTSLSGYDEFLRSVQQAISVVRLPEVRRTIASGDGVSFGPIRFTSRGIGIGRTRMTWEEMEKVYLGNGHLVVQLRSTQICQSPLRNIPNYSLLLNLINDHVGKKLERV